MAHHHLVHSIQSHGIQQQQQQQPYPPGLMVPSSSISSNGSGTNRTARDNALAFAQAHYEMVITQTDGHGRRRGRDIPKRLHVSNIPFKMNEEDLIMFFTPFGEVIDIEIIRNEKGSKGFGFITYGSQLEGSNAKYLMNRATIGNRVIEVNDAKPKNKFTFVCSPAMLNEEVKYQEIFQQIKTITPDNMVHKKPIEGVVPHAQRNKQHQAHLQQMFAQMNNMSMATASGGPSAPPTHRDMINGLNGPLLYDVRSMMANRGSDTDGFFSQESSGSSGDVHDCHNCI